MINKSKYLSFSLRLTEAMKNAGYGTTRSPNGICIKTLAEITNASEQICRRYIRGEALPDYSKILRISSRLSVSPGWLLFGENNDGIYNTSRKSNSIIIERDLLECIISKALGLLIIMKDKQELTPFIMDIIDDVTQIDANKEDLLKIIEISVNSAIRFNESSYDIRAKNR